MKHETKMLSYQINNMVVYLFALTKLYFIISMDFVWWDFFFVVAPFIWICLQNNVFSLVSGHKKGANDG